MPALWRSDVNLFVSAREAYLSFYPCGLSGETLHALLTRKILVQGTDTAAVSETCASVP